jgi:AraC-like DNA-binding protein
VAELAAEMGSSRSVFAERFLAVTGMTPHRYVTELRMRLAAQWIGRERQPIESVAFRLGYGSAAAFSRAFKRIHGYPPGALRQQREAGIDAVPSTSAQREPMSETLASDAVFSS